MSSQAFTLVEVDLKQTFTFPYSEIERVRKDYGGKGIAGRRVNPKKNLIAVTVIVGVTVTVLVAALAKDNS